MARSANTNYTATNCDFEKATADSDSFDAGDVQKLAEAVDTHDHASTKGLPVQRLHASQAAGDLFYATGAGVIARLAKGTGRQQMQMNSGATAPEWFDGYKVLGETILGSDTANIDFTSIPGTYRHLLVVAFLRGTTVATNQAIHLRLNNDSGANYDVQQLYVNNASVTGAETIGGTSDYLGTINAASAPANTFSPVEILIPNYAIGTQNKVFLSRCYNKRAESSGNLFSWMNNGDYRSNTAITRVTLYPGADNFLAASMATLYGIPF